MKATRPPRPVYPPPEVYQKTNGRTTRVDNPKKNVPKKRVLNEQWIKREGTLGEGFLTTMTREERQKALDACVKRYGYRSCLGKVTALERNRMIKQRYGSKLKESREYLTKKYGGPGSFGPQANPSKRSQTQQPELRATIGEQVSLKKLKNRLMR